MWQKNGLTKNMKIQVHIKNGQLLPVSQYDAERLEEAKQGQVYNLTATGHRSNPHHNLYWSTLRGVCKATGKWPTERHLHDELKIACGYYQMKYSTITGSFLRVLDSISFDDMTQQEFNIYFEMAMAKLTEAIGYDPITEDTRSA